jgi:hypothetical protein
MTVAPKDLRRLEARCKTALLRHEATYSFIIKNGVVRPSIKPNIVEDGEGRSVVKTAFTFNGSESETLFIIRKHPDDDYYGEACSEDNDLYGIVHQ